MKISNSKYVHFLTKWKISYAQRCNYFDRIQCIAWLSNLEFMIKTKNPMAGQWQLSAQAVTGLSDESVMAIAKFESIKPTEEPIIAKCWLSSSAEHDPRKKPLMVYVMVIKGIDGLIGDASVEVEWNNENGSSIHSIGLLDNGLGDPDITKCDGIYSQYIVDIGVLGYYKIRAKVGIVMEGLEL